jgi:hypothetical protein
MSIFFFAGTTDGSGFSLNLHVSTGNASESATGLFSLWPIRGRANYEGGWKAARLGTSSVGRACLAALLARRNFKKINVTEVICRLWFCYGARHEAVLGK